MKRLIYILLFVPVLSWGQVDDDYYVSYWQANNNCTGFFVQNALTDGSCEENDADGFTDNSGGDIGISSITETEGTSSYSIRLTMNATTGASEVVSLALTGLDAAATYTILVRAKRTGSGTNWRMRTETADGWDSAQASSLITSSTFADYSVTVSPSGTTATLDFITTTFNTAGNTLEMAYLTITAI